MVFPGVFCVGETGLAGGDAAAVMVSTLLHTHACVRAHTHTHTHKHTHTHTHTPVLASLFGVSDLECFFLFEVGTMGES